MAVEARHINLFPSQLLGNRQMMNPIEGNVSFHHTQMGFSHGAPLPGTTAAAAVKSDSGLTCNLPAVSRKRSRTETSNPLFISHNPPQQTQKASNLFSFLGEDLSVLIQRQQFDLDRLVSLHMEKVRIEIHEKRKRQARRMVEGLAEGVLKKLRAKEEEIEKIGKLNWALEERVKSLSVENQIWRDLAQTSEATANALRTNLEEVLNRNHHRAGASGASDDDAAESCCGSTGDGEERRVENGCRSCGKEEACVLLLPCRHLCLCTGCGSTVHTCPVCRATKNASVHVNMSWS